MLIISLFDTPTLPSVARLRQWSVLEVVDPSGKLVQRAVGLLDDSETRMRITSAITIYEGGQVLTESGSIYTLEGDPASAKQIEEQASRRAVLLGSEPAVDVTDRYRRGRS
jgi:hypothetical protein